MHDNGTLNFKFPIIQLLWLQRMHHCLKRHATYETYIAIFPRFDRFFNLQKD